MLVAVMGYDASNIGAIIKTDLNGNTIWAIETNFGCSRNDNYTIIPEANGYVVMGIGWWCGFWQPVIYRISLDGSTATLIMGFSNNYRAYKLIKDSDGNYALIGFYEPDFAAYLTRILPNGDILYSRRYTANNDLRFYDIEPDLDGHYLVSGTTRIGQTDYPIAMKINKNDGSVIWARYWAGAPTNQIHNQAKGIAPVNLNKILVTGHLGTHVDNHNGFVVILDSIDCMSDFSLSDWSPDITLSDYTQAINNLSLSEYNFSITQTPDCQVQPISDREYKSCNYRIYSGKGYIGVSSEKELNVSIYSINGYKIRDVRIKEGKIFVKSGVYILKVNDETIKLFVK
ncbi:MAG: hypothetical protein RMJ38_01195 [candidate division WOR-3 bacterium]|nr:hypothetical protein [candidate division WOR-3 bacterium]MDW8150043.1 hypothetical protein [candidate division WOR-3 bacterium]